MRYLTSDLVKPALLALQLNYAQIEASRPTNLDSISNVTTAILQTPPCSTPITTLYPSQKNVPAPHPYAVLKDAAMICIFTRSSLLSCVP